MEVVEIGQTIRVAVLDDFTVFDIVVVPAEHLADLQTRQEFPSVHEVDNDRDHAASDEVNGVVV